MSALKKLVVVLLGSGIYAHAQGLSPSQQSLPGCYEIVSHSWPPPKQSDAPHPVRYVPEKFELTEDRFVVQGRFTGRFKIEGIPKATDDAPRAAHPMWLWWPSADEVVVSFGNGFSGYGGTLKRETPTEFAGKLKYFCDVAFPFACRGPSARIRVRRVQCP